MKWSRMSGAGNRFLVGSLLNDQDESMSSDQVREVVDSLRDPDGYRVEGVLLLLSVKEHSFTADFHNPDGSHGMMCGNGARCIVRYATDSGVEEVIATEIITLEKQTEVPA